MRCHACDEHTHVQWESSAVFSWSWIRNLHFANYTARINFFIRTFTITIGFNECSGDRRITSLLPCLSRKHFFLATFSLQRCDHNMKSNPSAIIEPLFFWHSKFLMKSCGFWTELWKYFDFLALFVVSYVTLYQNFEDMTRLLLFQKVESNGGSFFQSGPRVLKKVLWTFSYIHLWHTMWFHAEKLLKTLKFWKSLNSLYKSGSRPHLSLFVQKAFVPLCIPSFSPFMAHHNISLCFWAGGWRVHCITNFHFNLVKFFVDLLQPQFWCHRPSA